MDKASLNPLPLRKRQKRYLRLVGREVEMLDIFRQLHEADQERVLLVIRGIARTTGPLFPGR
jgi:hypothetical protein